MPSQTWNLLKNRAKINKKCQFSIAFLSSFLKYKTVYLIQSLCNYSLYLSLASDKHCPENACIIDNMFHATFVVRDMYEVNGKEPPIFF